MSRADTPHPGGGRRGAPARGTFLRRAVIRGDGTALGVVVGLSGAGLVVLGLVDPDRRVLGLLAGAVLLGVAIGLVRASRALWRALLAEVAAAHAGSDPGPSPVPWVGDDLWRLRNRFDAELDAPVLLMAEVDPLVKGFGADATGAFTDVVLRPVQPEERELAPVDPPPPGVAVPEPADGPTSKARIEATPGRFVAVGPRWPVCCGRPSTLETDRLDARDPAALYLPADLVLAGQDDPHTRGAHGFRCRACGRRYATDPSF